MAWILVIVAGLFEVLWAVGMKMSDGFTRVWPAVATVVGLAASFGCLTLALRWLPIGTAYAVWTGIGAAGAAIAGVILFNEPATALRLGSIALVIVGTIGLKLAA